MCLLKIQLIVLFGRFLLGSFSFSRSLGVRRLSFSIRRLSLGVVSLLTFIDLFTLIDVLLFIAILPLQLTLTAHTYRVEYLQRQERHAHTQRQSNDEQERDREQRVLVQEEVGNVHVLLPMTPQDKHYLDNSHELQRLSGNGRSLHFLIVAESELLQFLRSTRAVELIRLSLLLTSRTFTLRWQTGPEWGRTGRRSDGSIQTP